MRIMNELLTVFFHLVERERPQEGGINYLHVTFIFDITQEDVYNLISLHSLYVIIVDQIFF